MIFPLKHRNLGTFDMLIDDEDYEKIKHLNITLNDKSNANTKYAKSIVYENCKYIKTIHIHRLIMGLGDFKTDKRIINHIDGNGLNNQKLNLEICDTRYNSQGVNRIHQNCKYVRYEEKEGKTKRRKKWRFQMKVNGVNHRKRFLTEEEANNYRDEYISNLTLINPYQS